MACGHVLSHISSFCGRPCPQPQGPRSYLNDTCAACHPPQLIRHIEASYQLHHGRLMEKWREAKARGDTRRMAALDAEMATVERERTEAKMKISRMVRQDGEVLWPGKQAGLEF